MGQPIPARTQSESKGERRRRWLVGGTLLAFALMAGTLALIAFAYVEQSDKVEALEDQNTQILDDHSSIGKAFVAQQKKLASQQKKLASQSRKLDRALRASYGQGFIAGQEALRLPTAFRLLARHAAAGLAVPRRVPSSLASTTPRVTVGVDGYAVRWPGLAVFASATDPLTVWTRQALGGAVQSLTLGRHRVKRLVGATGTIYAWRERGTTYALISVPQLEEPGRDLIESMR